MADDPDLTPAAGSGTIASPPESADDATTTLPEGVSPPRAGPTAPAGSATGATTGATTGASGGGVRPVTLDAMAPPAGDAPTVPPEPGAPTPPPSALVAKAVPAHADTPTVTRPGPRPSAPPITPPPPKPTPTPAAARPKSNWAAEVADRIDEVVAKVRVNTSDRLVGVARWVVFGLLAAVMGLTAVVLLVILAIRLLAVIFQGEVWLAYLVLGAIFLVLGLLLWTRRSTGPEDLTRSPASKPAHRRRSRSDRRP